MKVGKAVAEPDGMERVSVTGGSPVSVDDPWVDMASSVCAADVYNALSVAAGCGVADAN